MSGGRDPKAGSGTGLHINPLGPNVPARATRVEEETMYPRPFPAPLGHKTDPTWASVRECPLSERVRFPDGPPRSAGGRHQESHPRAPVR